jgi:hypothetical protein
LTRSFASRFNLRYAQPLLAKFKWTTNWLQSPQRSRLLTIGYFYYSVGAIIKYGNPLPDGEDDDEGSKGLHVSCDNITKPEEVLLITLNGSEVPLIEFFLLIK